MNDPKTKSSGSELIPAAEIGWLIHLVRDRRVILDEDLAANRDHLSHGCDEASCPENESPRSSTGKTVRGATLNVKPKG